MSPPVIVRIAGDEREAQQEIRRDRVAGRGGAVGHRPRTRHDRLVRV